jgi:hypothetical protein
LSADDRKDTARRTTDWEAELWSYLSRGDGSHCPIVDSCSVRQQGKWCFDDYIEEYSQLYGTPTTGRHSNEVAVFQKFVQRYFPKRWEPGRIFELVEALTDRCLKKYKFCQPPVPIELVNRLGIRPPIEVRVVPLKSYHGAVWHLRDGWVIQLNAKDPPGRQRVTLFHETFHILAHSKAAPVPVFRRRGISEGHFNEMLADYFASNILMPKSWVTEEWAEVKDLGRMADLFQVTELAMWIRLRTLGLIY